jgi:1-deoxy-D-xylulose-5-phosphate synthase
MAPKDGNELRSMLKTALLTDSPSAIRYPRGSVVDIDEKTEIDSIPIGRAELLREGDDILILAIGNTVKPSLDASALIADAGINASVINARFVKPLDTGLILDQVRRIKKVITVEENAVAGGFGSSVLEEIAKADIDGVKLKILGIPDRFIEQGSQNALRKTLGIDAEGIARKALQLSGKKDVLAASSLKLSD